MTTIRATCPTCGEVDLTPEQIVLTVIRADEAPVGPDSHYAFTCPSCTSRVEKPADERIAHLLTTGGVSVSVVDEHEADDRPPHPEAPTGGPALTYDDLLDLHVLLATGDWFDQLLSLTNR